MKPTLTLLFIAASAAVWTQPLTLAGALESAAQNRAGVRSAQLKLDEARLAARALGAYPATQIGIGHSSRADLGATDQDLFVSQPIDIFGRTSAARRKGQMAVRRAEADYRGVRLAVQSEVMRAYFEAATATRLSAVAQELLSLAENLHKAAIRRYEEGNVPEVQVTRAKIELDRTRQTASLRQSQLEAALRRLAGVMGVSAPDSVDPDAVLVHDGSTGVDRRPDVLAQLAEVELAGADANLASRLAMPELELIGLRSPWREQPVQTGLRLQLTWSVLDHGRMRSERDAAVKRGAAAEQELSDVRSRAAAELSAVEVEIKAAQERLATYREIQGSARSLVDKSRLGYTEGYGTLIDVLEATRALREIEQELAEARLELNLAEVARYEATGTLVGEESRGANNPAPLGGARDPGTGNSVSVGRPAGGTR